MVFIFLAHIPMRSCWLKALKRIPPSARHRNSSASLVDAVVLEALKPSPWLHPHFSSRLRLTGEASPKCPWCGAGSVGWAIELLADSKRRSVIDSRRHNGWPVSYATYAGALPLACRWSHKRHTTPRPPPHVREAAWDTAFHANLIGPTIAIRNASSAGDDIVGSYRRSYRRLASSHWNIPRPGTFLSWDRHLFAAVASYVPSRENDYTCEI